MADNENTLMDMKALFNERPFVKDIKKRYIELVELSGGKESLVLYDFARKIGVGGSGRFLPATKDREAADAFFSKYYMHSYYKVFADEGDSPEQEAKIYVGDKPNPGRYMYGEDWEAAMDAYETNVKNHMETFPARLRQRKFVEDILKLSPEEHVKKYEEGLEKICFEVDGSDIQTIEDAKLFVFACNNSEEKRKSAGIYYPEEIDGVSDGVKFILKQKDTKESFVLKLTGSWPDLVGVEVNCKIFDESSVPALREVRGNCALYHNASAPSLATVKGDCSVFPNAFTPSLKNIGGNCEIYAKASLLFLQTVGGNCQLYVEASAPSLHTVKGGCVLYKSASAPSLHTVGGRCYIHETASAPVLRNINNKVQGPPVENFYIPEGINEFSREEMAETRDEQNNDIESNGQNESVMSKVQDRPLLSINDGKIGVNLQDGTRLELDGVSSEKEGFHVIKKDGKFNYVSTDGNLLLKNWLDSASEFKDGKATVKRGGTVATIDKEGICIATKAVEQTTSKGNGLK